MKQFSVSGRGIRVSAVLLALAVVVGCSGDPVHDLSDVHSHDHAHHAPHGGALTMLGNHAFQLELLANLAAQQVELYLLDGEAENFYGSRMK